MKVLVGLLLATSFFVLLAFAFTMLGVVGLAVRWMLQVWSGGGSHRPYDWDGTEVGSPEWQQRPGGEPL
jgi:hypothetical protein